MIYAEPFVRGSDLSSQWRGPTSDEPHYFAEQGDAALAEARFRSALRINPDDSLAQDRLNELLKAKAVRKKRN